MSRSMWASTNSRTPRGADRATNDQPSGHHAPGLLTAAASSTKKCLKVLLAAGLLAVFALPASAMAAAGNGAKHHQLTRHRVVVLAYGAGFAHPDSRVRSLQRALARAGFSAGPVDGRYGTLTQAAVARFQAAHRLIVDGIAGPVTRGVLRHPGTVVYPGAGYGTSRGSAEVRRLQRQLSKAGVSPGPIDGRYGPRTERAVARYQASHGLTVDGIAGPITINRLTHNQNPNATHNPNPNQNPNSNHNANSNHNHKPTNGQPAQAHQPSSGAHGQHATPGTSAQPQPSGAAKPAGQKPGSAQHATNPGSSSGKGPVSLWLIDLLVALVLIAGLAALWLMRRRQRHAGQTSPHHEQAIDQRPAPSPRTALGNGQKPVKRPDLAPEPAERPAQAPEPVERPDQAPEPAERPAQAEEPILAEHRSDPRSDRPRDTNGDRVVPDRPLVSNGHSRASGTNGALGDPNQQPAEQAPGVGVGVLAPEHPAAAQRVFDHGALLEQNGDLTAAIVAYRRADRLGHGPAATNLGLLLEQEGDRRAARDAYARADQRGDAHGAFNLGVLLEEQGQLQQAMLAYQRADHRGQPAAATNLGVLLEQQGDLPAAEACYRRSDLRGDAHGAFNLAVLLEEKGDRLGALSAYRRASHRGHKQITELARAAMLELKQHPQDATAKEGGEHNGH